MDVFKLGDKILDLLEMVFGFWNNQIGMIFALLGQSPTTFKGGGPWKVIMDIEPTFVAVGSSLVVLFFVIGFCSESVDVKEELRFEAILRMLMRLGIAEWLVTKNVTIMRAFFTSVGRLVGLLSAGESTTLTINAEQAEIIKGLGFGESLIMLILAALLSINLGIMNILPFPALDGGRLLFLGIEMLRGKPASRKVEGYVNFAGLGMLFLLMIVLTYQDIVRLFP